MKKSDLDIVYLGRKYGIVILPDDNYSIKQMVSIKHKNFKKNDEVFVILGKIQEKSMLLNEDFKNNLCRELNLYKNEVNHSIKKALESIYDYSTHFSIVYYWRPKFESSTGVLADLSYCRKRTCVIL